MAFFRQRLGSPHTACQRQNTNAGALLPQEPAGAVGGAVAAARKGDKHAVGEEKGEWGSATATLAPHGAVEWEVRLNPGKAVRLPLEYELRFPGGESVVVTREQQHR